MILIWNLLFIGGACIVMVILIGNGHNELSTNQILDMAV